jgi:hypothetical protein
VGRIVPGMTRRVAAQDRWQSSNLASPTLWALGRDRPPAWPRRELAYSDGTGGNAAVHALRMDVCEHRRLNPQDGVVFDAADDGRVL